MDKDVIDKKRMLKRLEVLDDYLKEFGVSYQIYLFGSCLGMYHLEQDYRKSLDIDFQSKQNLLNKEIKNIMSDMEIHEIGGIMDIPPLEELEIVEKIDYGNLTVFIPSIENFALSKLLSNRRKDYDDLANYPILDKCNLSKLKHMLDEYLPYFPFNENLFYNFNYFEDLLENRNLKISESIEENLEDNFEMMM